jgi:hypothetical protein
VYHSEHALSSTFQNRQLQDAKLIKKKIRMRA